MVGSVLPALSGPSEHYAQKSIACLFYRAGVGWLVLSCFSLISPLSRPVISIHNQTAIYIMSLVSLLFIS